MLKSFNFVDDIDLCLCIIYTHLHLHIYKFFRSVTDQFGISKDIVWNCVFEVALLLTEDAYKYIKWPELHEMAFLKENFVNYMIFLE